jgi:hypothetical protein
MTRRRYFAVPPHLSSFPDDMAAVALAEDAKVKKILRAARSRPPAPMVTAKSTREGAALMAEFHSGSAAALMGRIERKELLTREELVERLGGNSRWVKAALESGRLFSIQAPSGVDYFPAFYAAPSIDRRALGKVAKVLCGLPGPSRYHFFVSQWFTLRMTPLEALSEGRLKEVLATAAGFAER